MSQKRSQASKVVLSAAVASLIAGVSAGSVHADNHGEKGAKTKVDKKHACGGHASAKAAGKKDHNKNKAEKAGKAGKAKGKKADMACGSNGCGSKSE